MNLPNSNSIQNRAQPASATSITCPVHGLGKMPLLSPSLHCEPNSGTSRVLGPASTSHAEVETASGRSLQQPTQIQFSSYGTPSVLRRTTGLSLPTH